MPKTDNELLREGCKSYHKALFAVMEFRRQVQDAISGVVEERLGEVAAAMKMDENELRDGLGSYAEPANFNQSYKGDSAAVGIKTPTKWPTKWILYFCVWVTTDDDSSYFTASVWLKEPGAAIEKLESLAVPEELEAYENYAGIFEYLPADGPVDLSAICNRVLDKWIDLWNKVGGLRQFLPAVEASTRK
jgi:hypothetical protein